MGIQILSDSTCDLSQELLEQYGIALVPLYVVKDGQSYRDGVDIHPSDIFAHVDAGGSLCSTAAASAYDYEEEFRKYVSDHEAVILITIGSGFSSTCQNAREAAKKFPNAYVVDSQNLSSGQGLAVLKAAELAAAGLPAEEIVRELESFVPRVETSFIMDRLDYMRKGGRCSALAVFGAALLSIKPCIEVKDGKLIVAKKYRGSFEKCLEQYVQDRLSGREGELDRTRIFLTHTAASDAAVSTTRKAIQKYGKFQKILETRAGCTVSCHCGPHTLGILFVRNV